MTIVLLIILIISLVGIVGSIILAICKAGAMSDYELALLKCKTCVRFKRGDRKYRLIYCEKGCVLPDETQNCKQYFRR